MQEQKALSSRGRGRLRGFLELRRPWALQSLQGKIDLIYACVQDLVFHYWADRDLRVAFSTHPESQASSRGEAKDTALLSSRDADLLERMET